MLLLHPSNSNGKSVASWPARTNAASFKASPFLEKSYNEGSSERRVCLVLSGHYLCNLHVVVVYAWLNTLNKYKRLPLSLDPEATRAHTASIRQCRANSPHFTLLLGKKAVPWNKRGYTLGGKVGVGKVSFLTTEANSRDEGLSWLRPRATQIFSSGLNISAIALSRIAL